MITLKRTDADDPQFRELVSALNEELARRDGADHPLAQFNSIAELKMVLVAYCDEEAVGCAAMARYDERTVELKRMYVLPDFRGQRIGERILVELEHWAKEMGVARGILFMGSRQPEAQQLYLRNGYHKVDKYGPLREIADCQCFAKALV
jgi:putative acetyltransferase